MRSTRAARREDDTVTARVAVNDSARRHARATLWWAAAIAIVALLAFVATSHAAAVAREGAVPAETDGPNEPRPVEESEVSERIVVDPHEPWDDWGDWGDIDEHFYHYRPGGLRIDTWVDRGEWATYEPGDRVWVYFRVNRPCYVTILDYTTDGRVETIYPNRWSGSSKVYPGRTYRVPDDRRFSLRIAGPGGIETLVACAHELPWPSVPGGWWVPPYHMWLEPHGRVVPGGHSSGRVVPGGRPSGQVVPGGRPSGRVVVEGGRSRDRYPWWGRPRGRVVVGRDWWPVPDRWHGSPERWAYDSVSFRVVDDYDAWGYDWWHGGDWDDDGWDHDDWDDDDWNGGWHGYGRPLMHERFRMSDPRDSMHETFRYDDEKVHVKIDCIADRKDDPTEIIGRVGWFGGWGDDLIFHIDASGRQGVVPRRGDVYAAFTGPIRVEVEVVDVRMVRVRPWQLPRIEWIKFDVKAYGAR